MRLYEVYYRQSDWDTLTKTQQIVANSAVSAADEIKKRRYGTNSRKRVVSVIERFDVVIAK